MQNERLNVARWTVLGLLAVSILVLTFAVGYVIADSGGGDAPGTAVQSDDAATETDFSQLNQILRLLKEKYVDPDRIDDATLYDAAIAGMLDTLSDAGVYYIDEETLGARDDARAFEGIGATVSEENGQVVIVRPIPGTPAERAGILAGDIILAVDGEEAAGWTSEVAVLKIRGPQGTVVTLTVQHTGGEEETIEIERDQINVPSVSTVPPGGALEDGAGETISDVGYIYISEFRDKTTEEQFDDALREVVATGKRGLILDLRNNPGGLLSTTVNIADEFLDEGVIISQRERDGSEDSTSARNGGIATDIPVVVILNRFSASGSEVLAAALKENGRATIIGEKSFGKGTVNVANDLRDGGQLYVSVAKWLTPNGTQIDGVGIRPDVSVTLSDEDIDLRRDVQLFKALDILRGTDTTPLTALTPSASETPEATPTIPGG